jgi:predicted nucleic acid-binding protein
VSLVLDTGIVFAYYDRSDDWHARARAVMNRRRGTLILPAPVIPEIDHLLGARLGREARMVFYDGLVGGHYYIADLPRHAYRRVVDIHRQFSDLDLGFVDAAVVAIAIGMGIPRVATSDRRHFAPLAKGFGLELLP